MIVTYEFLSKEKWIKEEAVFETKEQAENFISILKDNESYKNFKEVEEIERNEMSEDRLAEFLNELNDLADNYGLAVGGYEQEGEQLLLIMIKAIGE